MWAAGFRMRSYQVFSQGIRPDRIMASVRENSSQTLVIASLRASRRSAPAARYSEARAARSRARPAPERTDAARSRARPAPQRTANAASRQPRIRHDTAGDDGTGQSAGEPGREGFLRSTDRLRRAP